jgi:S-adenosylmethionine hydrolase
MHITLMTDFGMCDSYSAVMKGVIASINPHAQVIDITHSLPAFDIQKASFELLRYYEYFPYRTIHVVVVDPGVGSSRRILAVKTDAYYFLLPDNGIISHLVSREKKYEIREVTNENFFHLPVSATFHGRDIFAPVAAHLSMRDIFSQLGDYVTNPVLCNIASSYRHDDSIYGVIQDYDSFGNAILSIQNSEIDFNKKYIVRVDKISICECASTYANAPMHALVMIPGSSGYIEIACRNGSARSILSPIEKGQPVTIQERR